MHTKLEVCPNKPSKYSCHKLAEGEPPPQSITYWEKAFICKGGERVTLGLGTRQLKQPKATLSLKHLEVRLIYLERSQK